MVEPLNRSAQSILGADFITPEEITKARPSIGYAAAQIAALTESLPSEDVLNWCKENGYAVMPAPPIAMSILDVRVIQPAHFYFKAGAWYDDREFAHDDRTSFGWLLIKKTPAVNSIGKKWQDRDKFLSALERVPNAAEMSWFITTYFEVRGVRLFGDAHVRTSSLGVQDSHITVGGFGFDGFNVFDFWDNETRGSVFGLSAARK